MEFNCLCRFIKNNLKQYQEDRLYFFTNSFTTDKIDVMS